MAAWIRLRLFPACLSPLPCLVFAWPVSLRPRSPGASLSPRAACLPLSSRSFRSHFLLFAVSSPAFLRAAIRAFQGRLKGLWPLAPSYEPLSVPHLHVLVVLVPFQIPSASVLLCFPVPRFIFSAAVPSIVL